MTRQPITAALALLAALLPAGAQAREFTDQFRVDFEFGPTYIAKNNNRYGDQGTLLLAEEIGQQENLILGKRLSLEVPLSERNQLVFVYAPLDVTTRATLAKDVNFNDVLFPNGTVIDTRYLFDGYRLSWLWSLLQYDQLKLQIGLSGQVRNAQVALSSVDGTRYAQESDIGLVGALKARLYWDPLAPGGPYWLLDADAFSTFGLIGDVTGAIWDVAATFAVPVARGTDLIFRGRLLGGGATVPDKEIENWGNFAALTFGARVDLESLVE